MASLPPASPPSAPPPPAPPPSRAQVSRLAALLHGLSLASAVSAALLGALVVQTVGPDLAMGVAILAGQTLPDRPVLPFPWLPFGALLLAALLSLRGRRARWLSHPLAILAALMPWWQLWRLAVQAIGDGGGYPGD